MTSFKEKIYRHYKSEIITDRDQLIRARLNPRKHYIKKLIKNFFPEDKEAQILDLGCGNGAILFYAREDGYTNLKGYDASVQQIEEARIIGLPPEVVESRDIFQATQNLPMNNFDLIITFDVLEHFTKQQIFDFSEKVFSLLRSGGKWLIHCPNGASPFFGKVFYGDMTHETAFTAASFDQLKNATGFRGLLCFEDMPVIHGFKSFVRAFLWKLARLSIIGWSLVETGSAEKICSQNFLAILKK